MSESLEYHIHVLLKNRWDANLFRDAEGSPLLPPLFVLDQGAAVAVIDLRGAEAATGLLGYVPGSVFLEGDNLEQALPEKKPVALISRTGEKAARVARRLEKAGRSQVAAMAGGLIAWRKLGLKTSHDPTGVREKLLDDVSRRDDGVSLAHVQEHIGDPRNVRWIKLASMTTYGFLSCIDGRDGRGVVGTLGGDAGEFLLSLAVLEKATGVMLDEDAVSGALTAHADAFGEFYMHSDLDAFEQLAAALRGDPKLSAVVEELRRPEDLADFLSRPKPDMWDALLEHIVVPDHVGCGHIRLMLQHGEEYGIRSDLVVFFLRAFYRQWWGGSSELSMTLLPGGHDEAAVLQIRLDDEIWGITAIPLVSPTCGGRQMFVSHPNVSSYLRESIVRFYLDGLGIVPVAAEYKTAMKVAYHEIATRQLTATLGYLAKGLPIYNVNFARDGSFTVAEA